uniref:NADH dehydrogenase subunit 1 n=1 Tax=Penicillidia dufourii TaxID=1321409 RepID=UPI0025520000|nr:NADH dehydrogenase subunit 1 [Penicillidia dufourii]WGH15000.1 NADH dehydrogenase subunit 1 [Penicillidia dufourii]
MINELILVICEFLLLILFVLVGVGYLTLMERKVLGYIQIRKGPNKVSIIGLLQPICDAIKLFTSEQIYIMMSNYYSYLMAPIFSLFFSMLLWLSLPYFMNMISFDLSIIFFYCCISMNVYPLMIAGWSSNSKYALLGGLRGVAQTISYEISLVLIMMSMVFLIDGYNLILFMKYQEFIDMIMFMFPISLVWFMISLAEVNRAPFDFAEGESELVSGFNIEYGGGGFALIFLAEYMMIMFMSFLFSLMFLGMNMFSFMFYVKFMLILFLFIWVRGTFPRFRYDKLMYLAWKSFLPFSLNMLLFIIGYKIIMYF